jgi:hypothetical protein
MDREVSCKPQAASIGVDSNKSNNVINGDLNRALLLQSFSLKNVRVNEFDPLES